MMTRQYYKKVGMIMSMAEISELRIVNLEY
jgi:hypothetical protein